MNKTQRVLQHLKSGKSITGLEALRLYGLYRLSSVVHILRDRGYHIRTDMVQIDKQAPYASYILDNAFKENPLIGNKKENTTESDFGQ